MNELGRNKPIFLEQVRLQRPGVEKLLKLLNLYRDLELEDLRGYVDDSVYAALEENINPRDQRELSLWSQASKAVNTASTVDEIKMAKQLLQTYISQYPSGPCYNEAMKLINDINNRIMAAREENDWNQVDRKNYSSLRGYMNRYPNSVHLDEIDDLMWDITCAGGKLRDLERYLADWSSGRHAVEASSTLNEIGEWERLKREGDIFDMAAYRSEHPNSPFKRQIDARYFELCDLQMEKMKKKPWEFSKDYVERLIDDGIFTKWDLEDNGLITEQSWETLQLDREMFPDITNLQMADPNITVPEGTDIYLFGTPGTGKTCLLMGLSGANGLGYTLNMRLGGGPYAAALQQYINAGITPGPTFGTFVTAINGQVNEEVRNRVIPHPINLVEMSGEEFATRIADNQEVSLSNMGTGATNLMQNTNRKVFLIIVDATDQNIKFQYVEKEYDDEGNIVGEHLRRRYISQLDILNKFVSLFSLPENQEIMSRVDAIHFVVTKSDTLGDTQEERINKAFDLLTTRYIGPVQMLKNYCMHTGRINYSTNYSPMVFTFSLGKFYLGDIYHFDNNDTLQIVDVIRQVTIGKRQPTFWNRITNLFN